MENKEESKGESEEFNVAESHAESVDGGESIGRIRLPRGKEVMGILEQRMGASRILIKCFD